MQPHDHLFRHVLSQPEHAAGELQTVLPAPLSAQIEWSTLTLIAGSFVDPSLQLVDDLSKARDYELGRRAKMTALGLLTLFFLERARTSDDFVGELMERLQQLREVVNAPNGMASLAALLRYASMVTDTRPERLRVVAQALGPKSEVILMSAAEEWMMEGRAQGKAQAVLSVLEARGLAVSVADRERIAKCTDLAMLDNWLRRAATVATIAEVLAD